MCPASTFDAATTGRLVRASPEITMSQLQFTWRSLLSYVNLMDARMESGMRPLDGLLVIKS